MKTLLASTGGTVTYVTGTVHGGPWVIATTIPDVRALQQAFLDKLYADKALTLDSVGRILHALGIKAKLVEIKADGP